MATLPATESLTGKEPFINVNDNESTPSPEQLGSFTRFYVTITICSIVFVAMMILNVLCCCTQYPINWLDRRRENRWLVAVWYADPSKRPADLTELTVDCDPVCTIVPPAHHYRRPTSLNNIESQLL